LWQRGYTRTVRKRSSHATISTSTHMKLRFSANPPAAKAHSIAYLFPFYPRTGLRLRQRGRGTRTEIAMPGYVNHEEFTAAKPCVALQRVVELSHYSLLLSEALLK